VNRTATRRTALAASLLIALAGPARAQSAENPMLILTVTGGWITGGELWRVSRQPSLVAPAGVDTVGLERRFSTGVVVGVDATLFRSPHIGYTVGLTFLGVSTESRCASPAQWVDDPNHVNEHACSDVQGRNLGTSAVAVQLGLTWRPIATGRIQPYLKGVAGPAYLGESFVETSGTVPLPNDSGQITYPVKTLLGDPNPRTLTWVATLSAGVTLAMGQGTQFRFEAREVLTDLPVATGPGNPLTQGTPAPIGSRIFHLPSFTVGLDILLEQSRRPHRY
jgi:hypothetical protein